MTSSCEAERRVQASGHQQASTPRMCFPWWTMPVGARTLRCVGSCFQNSSDVDVVTIKVRVLPPRGRLLTVFVVHVYPGDAQCERNGGCATPFVCTARRVRLTRDASTLRFSPSPLECLSPLLLSPRLKLLVHQTRNRSSATPLPGSRRWLNPTQIKR